MSYRGGVTKKSVKRYPLALGVLECGHMAKLRATVAEAESESHVCAVCTKAQSAA